jgi:hypothetical protein
MTCTGPFSKNYLPEKRDSKNITVLKDLRWLQVFLKVKYADFRTSIFSYREKYRCLRTFLSFDDCDGAQHYL